MVGVAVVVAVGVAVVVAVAVVVGVVVGVAVVVAVAVAVAVVVGVAVAVAVGVAVAVVIVTTSLPCRGCATPVAIEPTWGYLSTQHGTYCPACLEAVVSARMATEAAEKAAALHRTRFRACCPPCYSDTVLERLPSPNRSLQALAWSWQPGGLNLWGWPRTGKSRTASVIMERTALSGRTVAALGPGGFREQCERRNWKRGKWLRRLSDVDLLFMDDIDKMNLTREMERDLFSVLNERMGRLPVIVTGNTQGDTLKLQFRLGEALVARIRDFCQSIHFPKP